MDRKLGIVIQARTGSTRLPGKVLMPVGGETLILRIYNRLKDHLDFPIIIATTLNAQDDPLVDLVSRRNISIYRGSEDNVVCRFIGAAKNIGITDIIRICADNPLLDIDFLDQQIRIWEEDFESDYISFEYNQRPVILSHFGVFAEIVKLSALEKVGNLFPENRIFMEHVTNGIYKNPELFKIRLVNLDKQLSPFEGVRLTIDTIEDLDRISEIVLKAGNENFENIAVYIKSRPDLLLEMKAAIQKNIK
jgi:spore coat polysaccharide biosynthesis protein SpsF